MEYVGSYWRGNCTLVYTQPNFFKWAHPVHRIANPFVNSLFVL